MYSETIKTRAFTVLYVLGLIGLFAVALELLHKVHLVASVLAISILLAYLIAPAVNFLSRRGFPRVFAITIVYVVLAGLLAFAVAYLIPVATREFNKLVGNLGYLAANLESIVVNTLTRLHEWAPDPMKPMVDPARFQMSDLTQQIQREGGAVLQQSLPGLFSGVKAAGGLLAGAVLVPLLTFYILMDADKYRRGFMAMVPRPWRTTADELLNRVDLMLGHYIRGQIVVCITIGFSISVALTLLGVEYAVLIGVFAGVVEIIPYVGVAIGLIPAFLIALINDGILWALFVVVALEGIHWLEGHIIVPAVIGHSVGLPPLTVMVALMAGAELGGIMGMFVAIPAAAILRVLAEYYMEKQGDVGPDLLPQETRAGPLDPAAIVHPEDGHSIPLPPDTASEPTS